MVFDSRKLTLPEERRRIALAKKGSIENANEIILNHLDFVLFRIRRKVIPPILKRYEQDLLSDSIPILYRQIENYKLRYRDSKGNIKRVRFTSYIWKRIDGFITDSIKRALVRERIELPLFTQEEQ